MTAVTTSHEYVNCEKFRLFKLSLPEPAPTTLACALSLSTESFLFYFYFSSPFFCQSSLLRINQRHHGLRTRLWYTPLFCHSAAVSRVLVRTPFCGAVAPLFFLAKVYFLFPIINNFITMFGESSLLRNEPQHPVRWGMLSTHSHSHFLIY
jgi:hypothetical protein